MDDFAAMRLWCQRRADAISQQLSARGAKNGYSPEALNDPTYRLLLGQRQAYMHMLSFIHGARLRAASHRDEANERLAAEYVLASGKSVHASDCATSRAPAYEPGPCDCMIRDIVEGVGK